LGAKRPGGETSKGRNVHKPLAALLSALLYSAVSELFHAWKTEQSNKCLIKWMLKTLL